MISTYKLAMTPDERWYEAVKHLKKAAELLEGTLKESKVIDKTGEYRQFRIVFDEKELDRVQEEEE